MGERDVVLPVVGLSVESLAESVLLHLPALTDALVETIYAQSPAYRVMDAVPRQDLWRSCHDNVARVVQMIADNDDRFDAAQATGRRRAEQRMPLDDVLKSFRLGGRLVWEAMIEEARAQGAVDSEALLDVASKVWEVVDRTSSQVAAAYHVAERQLVRADERRRSTLWEGLLHGRGKDRAFVQEAATVLDVPIDGRYLVVAIDNLVDDECTTSSFVRRFAAVRVASAWQVRPQTVVGLLALGTESLPKALGILRDVVHAPAGLSGVVNGLVEVNLAYRQAMLARRTLPAGQIDVAALTERLPEALLLSAPELAGQLVQTWLVPLTTVPASERDLLLDTLDKWVTAAGSVRRTADLAHCHRNTVINRLHRVHQITGRDVTEDGCQLELGLALRAFKLFPA
ncbi:helix-turn-helix domain-containing protein [Kribbella sp. NPDC003505]|uniref:PucR family transcriptional regulator n=1 Tax=Kribbella sp. NPDC003505 TaxID=3154448 RepID=UPI0033A4015D